MIPHADISLALDSLNAAYAADPLAIHSLLCFRIPCNQALADHPTVQVGRDRTVDSNLFTVGLLGIVNGVVEPLTGKRIAAKFSDDKQPKFLGFVEYVAPADGEPVLASEE